MKNNQIITILMSFLILGCSNLKYLKKFGGFKGEPKKVESITYKVNYLDGIRIEEISKKDIYNYDHKGKEISHEDFKADGTPGYWGSRSVYDKHGNIIKEISITKDSSKYFEYDYKYNKYGQQTEVVYSRNEIKRTTTRIYDRINRTATVTFTNKEGKVKDKTIEKFDEKWRNTELLILDNMGNQSTRVEYSYNRNDCKIESKRYNRLNELYAINKNTYNSNNHRILQEKFKMIDGNFKLESESHTVHVYDEIGNCIEHAFGPIDKPSWIIKTSYEYN